jgi:hypothetical protein
MNINYNFIKALQPLGCEPKIYGQYLIEKKMKKRGGIKRKKRR